jgi:hypothetical protein
MISLFNPRVFIAAVTLLVFQPVQGAENPQEPLRLLHIGNSFSMDATRMLTHVAESGGKKIEIYGAVMSGCSLKRHAEWLRQAKAGEKKGSAYMSSEVLGADLHKKGKVSLPEALAAKPWDVVTIQQVSVQSSSYETYEPYASEIIATVRETAPSATLHIHQTWAYRPDFWSNQAAPAMHFNQMHFGAAAAYERLGKDYQITRFLPSGLAVYMANESERWKYQRDPKFSYENPVEGTLPLENGLYVGGRWLVDRKSGKPAFRSDTIHLGPAGQYLAACVWYEILFDESCLKVKYVPERLTPDQAADLRQLAHKAVEAYRAGGLTGGMPNPTESK